MALLFLIGTLFIEASLRWVVGKEDGMSFDRDDEKHLRRFGRKKEGWHLLTQKDKSMKIT